MMQQLLQSVRLLNTSPVKHDTDCKFYRDSSLDLLLKSIASDYFHVPVEERKVKSLENILKAKNKVKNELSELKDRLQLAKSTIQKFRDQVQHLQLGNPPQTSQD